jgi:hypothetical protein
MRTRLMTSVIAAGVLVANVASAEGLHHVKRPLITRAEGLHHVKRPLIARTDGLHYVKRPLVTVA